jgi:tetratricopeptide (TPR) repeat protein
MRISRIILLGLLVFAGCARIFAAGGDTKDLRAQLAAADDKHDTPAVAEISRRILKIEPQDQAVWETRVRALLKLGDLEHVKQALDEWEQQAKPSDAAATDLRGDLAWEEKKYDDALRCWSAYLDAKPDAVDTLKKIAWLHESRNEWSDAAAALTKWISSGDAADKRVWRARCYLQMRKWDDAFADIKKANELDASDEAVKQWLPKFETLEKSLPQIKALDAKIAADTTKWPLLLDRALLFYDAERYDLALEDMEDADVFSVYDTNGHLLFNCSVQLFTGYTLLAMGRNDDAAKLHMITAHKEFSEVALGKIRKLDAQILDKGPAAAPLTDRARLCNDLEQYALALEDAQFAMERDPHFANAFVEAGFALMKLERTKEAREKFTHATELDPKNFVAWRSLGEIEMERANYADAIGFFTSSLKLHESPKVLEKRATCYRNSGQSKEADADFQRFQKLSGTKKK